MDKGILHAVEKQVVRLVIMASSQSRSEDERARGNQLYKEATKTDVKPWIKQQRLQECFPIYQCAFNFAKNDDEKASAKKNVGLAYRQMASTFSPSKSEVGRLRYFMLEAVESFSAAYLFGKSCKTEAWLLDVYEGANLCIEAVRETVVLITDLTEKLLLLRKIASMAPDGLTKATCWLKLGEATFNAGVMAYEDQRFSDCHRHMAECNEPFEEALRYGKDDTSICEDAYDFQRKVFVHLCITESVSLRTQGESLFHAHLMNQENVDFDLMWEVADMFKQCTMLVREQDVEQEAISLSRLAKVFDVVLKLPEKAKIYYKRSFHLAAALFPRTFNTKDWYKDCSQALERYQKETVQREESKWQEERKPYLEELKLELKGLQEAFDEGYVVFVKYVYSTHPPKNPNHTLTGDGSTKKSVRMALIHYHTDKINKSEDTKWYVLCEEICKMLSQKYEKLKSAE